MSQDKIVKVVLSDWHWQMGNCQHECTITYASGKREKKICFQAKEFADLYKQNPSAIVAPDWPDVSSHMQFRFFPEPKY